MSVTYKNSGLTFISSFSLITSICAVTEGFSVVKIVNKKGNKRERITKKKVH